MKSKFIERNQENESVNTNINQNNPPYSDNMARILKLSQEYLGFVEGLGNECAYTDSIVSEIMDEAKKIPEGESKLPANFKVKKERIVFYKSVRNIEEICVSYFEEDWDADGNFEYANCIFEELQIEVKKLRKVYDDFFANLRAQEYIMNEDYES